MSDASKAASTSLEHASFPHLSSIEWEALHRLATAFGEAVIQTLLTAGTEAQQRLAAQEFMARELADLRRRVSTPTPTKSKTDIVKLDVSTYSGEGDGRLHLNRWFCEVDIAIEARQLSTELARTRFLLSKLTGKAKEWALGKLVADASCFPTMAAMKADLRLAFEPPQNERVQRSAFLSLKQGRMSILEYIQRVRHLISCITAYPVDMATQVHVFTSGMSAGYQRFYWTRKTPSTLEEAFAVALREDYSVTASQAFDVSQAPAPEPDPESMAIDAIRQCDERRGATPSNPRPRSSTRGSRPLKCFRCKKLGHRTAVCRAPAPVMANVAIENDVAVAGRAKNGDSQYVRGALLAVEGVAVLRWQNLLLALLCFVHTCLPPPPAATRN
ncbi:hypothetical protein PI125_g2947 [Phytophthora idaei]|nr:hypothetical protein PI125_g2947 [Phytophthora idaei]KAG3172790.1 hypothetical protein PI126_g1151 [Phytophthora idaei]